MDRLGGNASGADHDLSRARFLARERSGSPHRKPQRFRRLRPQSRRQRSGDFPDLRTVRRRRRSAGRRGGRSAQSSVRAAGFTPKSPVIEIAGICSHCRRTKRRAAFLNPSPWRIPPKSRPLDALAIAIVVGLSLSWGFNQVAIKLAIHDIPPLMQSAARSVMRGIWSAPGRVARYRAVRTRRHAAGGNSRRRPVRARISVHLSGPALDHRDAWRFVSLSGAVLRRDRIALVHSRRSFPSSQWFGLVLSFVGIVIAFGLPTPAADPRQMLGDIMLVGAAVAWAATTLVIKASALKRVRPKRPCSISSWSRRRCLAPASVAFGEHIDAMPSAIALGAFAYQTIWVVSVTFVDLVCADRALFGGPAVGIHLSHAAVRRGCRHFVLGEPLNAGVRLSRRTGRGRAGARKPAPIRLYAGGIGPRSRHWRVGHG